jgi:membrane protein DedA with SNARE-associated domain
VIGVIQQFGPLGVFALMVPESACIPVPSEVTLLFSGFAVSQHWMSFWLAVVAATAGNVVGSLVGCGVRAGRTGVRHGLGRGQLGARQVVPRRRHRAGRVDRVPSDASGPTAWA